jgi:hypothetical protein
MRRAARIEEQLSPCKNCVHFLQGEKRRLEKVGAGETADKAVFKGFQTVSLRHLVFCAPGPGFAEAIAS